jgi:hypothetical protein
MKKVDLSDLKVGDKAWSAAIGECLVTYIYVNVIQCNGTHEHNFDGTCYEEDEKHPTLFHSEQEFREYWGLGETLEVFESNTLTKRELKIIDKMVERAIDLITKLNEKP